MSVALSLAPTEVPADEWLAAVREDIDQRLVASLHIPKSDVVEPWRRALSSTRMYCLRPGKRLRPALFLAAFELGRPPSDAAREYAAAIELLHTFQLIHDDVADRAATRRGGPALHVVLEDDHRAIVMGDHLFALAVEKMLATGLPDVASVTSELLAGSRQTAAGRYLDLAAPAVPLPESSLRRTLAIAFLKTARFGFVAPLVAGARLAELPPEQVAILSRVGRHLGLAFQLRHDLAGLFGDDAAKPAAGDLVEGKRTFPVLAAWLRAPDSARRELEALWSPGKKSPEDIAGARVLVEGLGGRTATQRLIDAHARCASKLVGALPEGPGVTLLAKLVRSIAPSSSSGT